MTWDDDDDWAWNRDFDLDPLDDDRDREERPLFGCACENPCSVDTVCWACRGEMRRQYMESLREQLAALEAEAAADTAPHRAPDKSRTPNDAPPTKKGPTVMSNSPTETGSPTGSNPAGVAAPSTSNDSENPDRTELRSVGIDEDRPATRRPAVGDLVEVFTDSGLGFGFAPRWLPGIVDQVDPEEPALFRVRVTNCADVRRDAEDTRDWRWPETGDADAAGGEVPLSAFVSCSAETSVEGRSVVCAEPRGHAGRHAGDFAGDVIEWFNEHGRTGGEVPSDPCAAMDHPCFGGCSTRVGHPEGVCGRPACVAERDRKWAAQEQGGEVLSCPSCGSGVVDWSSLIGRCLGCGYVLSQPVLSPAERAMAAGVADPQRCGSVSPRGRLCSEDKGHEGLHSFAGDTWGEVPSEPEVRRCDVSVGDDVCGAVLGNLHCDVCYGRRCFTHCGGVDHFGGQVFARGGSGSVTWKIAEVAAGRFQGQLYRVQEGRISIVLTATSASPNEVLDRLEEETDQLERDHASAAGTIDKPATITSAAAAAVRATRGTPEQRQRVLAEVIEWLRSSETKWDELPRDTETAWQTIERCQDLHNRLMVELFARIGGAL